MTETWMDNSVIHLRINQGESDAMEENSMKKIMIIIGIAIALPVLSGCNTLQKQTLVDKNWGRSYETARFSQIVNPEAGEAVVEDQGMDGVSVKDNYDKYQKGFKTETPVQVFNVNVGGN